MLTRSILNISEKLGGFCEKENCDGQLFIKSACSFENEEKSSLFGNNFNEEQTRLSCSDNFPQLYIENKNFDFILNKNVSSGQCEKCPPNTFKTTEGVQNCIPCPDGRITGGVSGCIYLSDCYKNCSAGYIHNWENDKCIPCPRGQFMPYSGRLKCLACPIDRTTVGEGSINKEECSIKCKDGEEMGQNEQCQPCSKGTFREGLMSVCQRCQIGFTTKKEGSLNSKECNQINCPPGYFTNNKLINEEINLNFEFLQICLPCPIGYMTKQLGAKNIFECDQVWDGSCKPDQPEPCPNGSECIQIGGEIFECRKIFVEFLNNEQ
uniref:Tyrosine-protein kinase ephrin type A/B receptor-like domain-containing protein n=1 Tax=Meloidogyne floridensis TaxID=298350 RepID=A0A915NI93_9BILA